VNEAFSFAEWECAWRMKAQAGVCENAIFRRLYEQKRKHGSVFKRLANIGFHQPEVVVALPELRLRKAGESVGLVASAGRRCIAWAMFLHVSKNRRARCFCKCLDETSLL
jgi:hypothetical protein